MLVVLEKGHFSVVQILVFTCFLPNWESYISALLSLA